MVLVISWCWMYLGDGLSKVDCEGLVMVWLQLVLATPAVTIVVMLQVCGYGCGYNYRHGHPCAYCYSRFELLVMVAITARIKDKA